LKKIREFMKVCKLEFGWIDKNAFGSYNDKTKKVKINLVSMLVYVFLHEFMHEVNPKVIEKEIIKKTVHKMNRLTRKDIKEIGRFIWACFESELKLYIKKRKVDKR